MSENTNSYFDGGVLDNFINSLITYLIIMCTLCIALPWAVVYRQNYIISHTVVEGKRLRFDGAGIQLFGNYIKWYLLTVITLSIYGIFFVPVRIQQWVAKHTFFA